MDAVRTLNPLLKKSTYLALSVPPEPEFSALFKLADRNLSFGLNVEFQKFEIVMPVNDCGAFKFEVVRSTLP